MNSAKGLNNDLLKFQLNDFGGLSKKFIKQTLSKNSQGIFNLSSKIDSSKQQKIEEYLNANYKNYRFSVEQDCINSEIYFYRK